MGRRAVPARVKKSYADGTVLYAWRDALGGTERTGKGPGGKANILAFQAHVQDSWDKGQVPKTPSEVLQASVAPSVAPPALGKPVPTVADWVGTASAPGPFFRHSRNRMSEGQVKRYFTFVTTHGVGRLIGTKRLDQVTVDDAERVMDHLLACPRCVKRGLSEANARADTDVPGCPDHRPARLQRRKTVVTTKTCLGSLFNAAARAGYPVSNPFRGRTVGYWAQASTNDDCRTALTVPQFHQLLEAHHDDVKVVPALSVYGMLRLSEMWGLQRQDFPVPPDDPADDPATVTFLVERVRNTAQQQLTAQGKTPLSTGAYMVLPSTGAKIVNERLRRNLEPSSECAACAQGVQLWRGPTVRNPHDGCGWANDAPIIPVSVCSPRHYSGSVAPRAQSAAGLGDLPFRITHRSFRSTGATMYLRSGAQVHEVAQMGRWSDSKVLMQTYYRLYGEAYEDAAIRLARNEAAELGHDRSDAAPLDGRIRFLQRRVTVLEAANTDLRAENADLRRQLGLTERSNDEASPTAIPVRNRITKWGSISDDDLVQAIDSSASQAAIVRRLGLSLAKKNYSRLKSRADELNIALPPKWGTVTASDEQQGDAG